MISKFSELSKMRYKDQAVWFMNGFWGTAGKDAKGTIGNDDGLKMWSYVKKFEELDMQGATKKGAEGNELDQFWSAKFLEDMITALTAMARKEALRTIDQDNNGCMSAIEFLIWHYGKGVTETVKAPQGSSPALEEAKKKMEAVQAALTELLKLKAELQAAVAALHAEEQAYENKKKELEETSKVGGVKGNKAANELAQLKAEDPLPLRRAKITQEAALRKVEKQENQLMRDLKAAEQAVEEAKKGGGIGPGTLWWMNRELFEADSRLPTSKQRYDHRKPFLFDPVGTGSGWDGGVTPRGVLSPMTSPR